MRPSSPSRTRALLGAFAAAIAVAGAFASAQTGVVLTSTTSPTAAQAGITTVSVTGAGFPAGTITPASVILALQPAAGGAITTTPATALTTISGTTRRATFSIPATVSVTAPTAYRVSLSGKTTTGVAFASTNTAALTINPPPRITSLTPASALPGTTVTVAITTEFTNFVQGSTQASFGAGISVGGAAAGSFGLVTVQSPTTATAQIAVGAGATPGAVAVTVRTGIQSATLANAFTVSAPNTAPVVNAGPDLTITLPSAAALAGSVTDDGVPAGSAVTQTWSQISGPGTATFANPTSASTTATFSQAGSYVLRLTASDTQLSASDDVAVTVAPANQPPTVNAGGDQSVTLPAAANLTGTVTDDGLPGGTTTSTWTKVSGPGTVTFANAAAASTSATFDQAGTYVLRLTASDTTLTAFDEVTITVAPPPNHVPTANPGQATYSAKAGQPVQFDAIGSTDPDGDPLTFAWNFGDQTTGTGSSPQHTYLSAGTFNVTLIVDDGKGGTATATTQAQIAPAGLGRGIITGRVFNDADGLPIAGATITLASVNGGTGPFDHPQTQSDSAGRYRLPSPNGTARLSIAKDGFTATQRTVAVVDSKRVNPLDAWLTPLDPKTVTVTSVLGNTVANSTADVRLAVPAGALDSDSAMRATKITGQGLADALPLGWSPVAAVEISPRDISLRTASSLTVVAPSNLPADAAVSAARWDASAGWVDVGLAVRSSDGTTLQAAVTRTGQYAFVVGDPGSVTPAAGQPLAPAAAATPSNAAVTITPSPRILFANTSAHSLVHVLVTPSGAMPSGSPVTLDVSESYALSAGSLFLPRTPRSLPLYRFAPATPDGAIAPLEARMIASPSRTFSAFQLSRGTIDLAARLPASATAPYGALIPASGGDFTSTTGERIVVASGAFDQDLPVSVERVDVADLAGLVPSTVSVNSAIAVDFHGATLSQPATLSLPIPSGVAAGTQLLVLRLTDVGDSSVAEVVALASVRGSALETTTDPLGDGSVVFPGVRRDGWYAFATTNQPFGFVTGFATGTDGLALSGAVVASGFGVAAITGADGRYALVAAPGTTTLTTRNVATGDQTTTTAQVTAGANSTQSVAVGPTALTISSISPQAGSTGVALASVVRVLLSAPVDPATTTGAVTLSAGGSPVAGSLTLSTDGQTLVLRPSALLTSNTSYQISVAASLRGVNGRPLTAPGSSTFTTINLTAPPPPAAGTISATIPGAGNTTTISGTQGSVDPTSVVLIKNVRTGAVTTLSPNADGSFSGVVAALTSDQLQMTIRSAAGVTTAVPLPAFRNPDGSVVVGAAGGHVDGPAGVAVDVPPGAIPDGTIVRIAPVPSADLPAGPPDGFERVGALQLDLGGITAAKPLSLSIPAPVSASVHDEVIVSRPVPLKDRIAWNTVDRAPLKDGRYADGEPFSGVLFGGTYVFDRSTANCLSYVSVTVSFGIDVTVFAGVAFAYPVAGVQIITVPAVCSHDLTVQVVNSNTDAVIAESTAVAPAVQGTTFTVPTVVSDDHTPPAVTSFKACQTREGIPVTPCNTFEIDFSEAMDSQSVSGDQHLIIQDGAGSSVPGNTQLLDGGTVAIFRPSVPFLEATTYRVLLFGMKDRAGNLLDADPISFSTFEPRVLSSLTTELAKTIANAADVAYVGNTLFIANGVRSPNEQYLSSDNLPRLLAVDVSNPENPRVIGSSATTTNPLRLATLSNASFAIPGARAPAPTKFAGDLLLVAGGGRTAQELPAKLEIWDITACTATPAATPNCLASGFRGAKLLSTPADATTSPGVPPIPGVPTQVSALHSQQPDGTTAAAVAYVVVAAVGVEAVDITRSFNAPFTTTTDFAPDGLLLGDFLDVTILKDQVFLLRNDAAERVLVLVPPGLALNAQESIPLFTDHPLDAARIASAENFVLDVDGDGNLGSAEDADGDATTARDELFDFIVVGSGPLTTGCVAVSPCGELDIFDVSSRTDLKDRHPGGPSLVARIPLPGAAFSIAVDRKAQLAYVEVRGLGLTIVDLSSLVRVLRHETNLTQLLDANGDGRDDRVLGVVPATNDIIVGEVKLDAASGLVYSNGASSGVTVIQVGPTALYLDFSAFEKSLLSRVDYYPSLGYRLVKLRAIGASGRPGGGVVEGCAVSGFGASPGDQVTMTPRNPDPSSRATIDGDGLARFELDGRNLTDETPAIPPIIGPPSCGARFPGKGQILVAFRWTDPENGRLHVTEQLLTVRTNRNTSVQAVLNGTTVMVADATHPIAGTTTPHDVPGTDPVVKTKSAAPASEQRVDFVQEMLNETVPRHSGAIHGAVAPDGTPLDLIVDEDGLFGSGTADQIGLFRKYFGMDPTNTNREADLNVLATEYDLETKDVAFNSTLRDDGGHLNVNAFVTKFVLARDAFKATDRYFGQGSCGESCPDAANAGLYEVYSNIVRPFIESKVHAFELFRDNVIPQNRTGAWKSRPDPVNVQTPPRATAPVGPVQISSVINNGGTATATTNAAHGFQTGDAVQIAGAGQQAYNGLFNVTVTTPTTFTYTISGAPPPETGTITAVSADRALYDGKRGASYCYGCEQYTNEVANYFASAHSDNPAIQAILQNPDVRFEQSVSAEGPPRKNAVAATYRGSVESDPSGNPTLKWFPGLYEGESPNQPQYNPKYWAGTDCSGLENIAANYAKLNADLKDWISPRFADIPVVVSHGANNDKTVAVVTLMDHAFPSATVTTAWSYVVSEKAPLPVIRAGKWAYLHRGDSILEKGHVMTAYSEKKGNADYDFAVIHAFGPPLNLFHGKFARKVTVSDPIQGGAKPTQIAREILW